MTGKEIALNLLIFKNKMLKDTVSMCVCSVQNPYPFQYSEGPDGAEIGVQSRAESQNRTQGELVWDHL